MICRQPLHELRRGIFIRPVVVVRCGTYTGKFDGRGALTGQGRFEFEDGTIFEGHFVRGKIDGNSVGTVTERGGEVRKVGGKFGSVAALNQQLAGPGRVVVKVRVVGEAKRLDRPYRPSFIPSCLRRGEGACGGRPA